MHLLLTRPEGRNETLRQALAERGVASSICPMVAIEALTPPPAPFSGAVGAFFVSRTAVALADKALGGRWPELPCFAVGVGTAEALANCGVEALYPAEDQQTSEGVLALSQLKALREGPFVIVRGEGGRETLAESLSQRGFQIRPWILYRRVPPKLDGATLVQGWHRDGVDAILATSGEILENLFSLLPLAQHAWLRQCHWLVPVERVAQLARQRGCQHVTVLGGAGDDAILGCIGKLTHYGEHPQGS
ncbi:uroporphyrinogen-III synthase [Ferrimonas gelatinilytica]|uniref:Uroporphyrinogen-III synthase n=1 Tax=Ferrimonas gelatinilytica TaxID=1255257 RepID=A0ABP9RTM9_9GAMM